jgi:hypothetical protein
MSTHETTRQSSDAPSDQSHISSQRNGARPAFFLLGRSGDRDLVASTRTNTIYAVAGTEVVHRYVFGSGDLSLDEFMAAYDDAHGWDERYYGCLSGMVSRAMDA